MPRKQATRKWSAKVTKTSDAMDLKKDVFKSGSAKEIEKSVKHSAETSKRRKSGPFQSAMSMLNFYENRAGKNLPANQRKKIDAAKDELRKDFQKKPA